MQLFIVRKDVHIATVILTSTVSSSHTDYKTYYRLLHVDTTIYFSKVTTVSSHAIVTTVTLRSEIMGTFH